MRRNPPNMFNPDVGSSLGGFKVGPGTGVVNYYNSGLGTDESVKRHINDSAETSECSGIGDGNGAVGYNNTGPGGRSCQPKCRA